MLFRSWSKTQKTLFGILSGAALLGAVMLILFAVLKKPVSVSVSPDEYAESDPEAGMQRRSWTVSQVSIPKRELPAPVITFKEDPSHPMPEDGSVLALGEPYTIGGTIYSNRQLSTVTVSVSCSHNGQAPYPYRKSVQLTETGTGTYTLTDPNTDNGKALSELVDFSQFLVGVHTLKVTAACEGARSVEVFRCRFYVAGPDWDEITEENFPDSYPEALSFFKDTNRFLYRYQWVNGRYIMADPEWEKEYITTIQGYPNDEPWLVHVDAVPYFEKAFDYLNTSFLRVHGTNGDTGLVRASDLITEYNGCYVSRFTSSLKSISHHTFGTAVDVNASMDPNKNLAENTAVIDEDVKDHLTFNGLMKAGDITYYDFTYDGSYALDPNGIPQTCVNYLLYELGFFRAGFGWAHYYKSTSDGMHFCLSEFITYSHEDKDFGLRKVFVYAPPIKPDEPLPSLDPVPLMTPVPEETSSPLPSVTP